MTCSGRRNLRRVFFSLYLLFLISAFLAFAPAMIVPTDGHDLEGGEQSSSYKLPASRTSQNNIDKSFRERRLSSHLVLRVRSAKSKNGKFLERYNRLVPDEDKNQLFRTDHTDGLYFVLKPVVDEIRIYDGPTIGDYIDNNIPLLRMLHKFTIHILLLKLGLFFLLLCPFAFMRMTDTTRILFGNYTKLRVNSSDIDPPWAPAFDTFALYYVGAVCGLLFETTCIDVLGSVRLHAIIFIFFHGLKADIFFLL